MLHSRISFLKLLTHPTKKFPSFITELKLKVLIKLLLLYNKSKKMIFKKKQNLWTINISKQI